jgi:hypothetical protein
MLHVVIDDVMSFYEVNMLCALNGMLLIPINQKSYKITPTHACTCHSLVSQRAIVGYLRADR